MTMDIKMNLDASQENTFAFPTEGIQSVTQLTNNKLPDHIFCYWTWQDNTVFCNKTYVASILNGEMEIHRGYMARLGITEAQAESVKPSLSNQSYTAYMRAVAAEEGPAEIMAAVLSCAISYEYIAKWIVKNYPDAENHDFYGEWVRGYASESYAAENHRLIALMERLSGDYTEEQLQRLTDIFVACSRYEAMFWDMAWNEAM